ncbi:MAG TPA: sugar phosphate isomerase/epimerase [Bryobacteraceae bacterium]|jgi:sugar phosphate isomerase/epimerase|nr:sugar phosphate isomerase/epimerase [Bryobacteraceae bacterium]
MTLSRRELLALAALAPALGANPLGLPIGSQTYPFRQRIREGDFAGVCKDLAELGVGAIELCSPAYSEFAGLADPKQTRKIIADHGLQCPSSHFPMNELRHKQEEAIAWAAGIGMTQMGTASLGGQFHDGVTTIEAVKRAADEYNQIAGRAAKAGIQQFLHDENFEMSKLDDGRLTYQMLLELLDPKLVKMQFQMSAMNAVGDPVMYFTKYPGRFISMHLQGQADGKTAAVGKDSLDWPRIFAAAKTGGVKNYIVEMSWDLTVASVGYLKTLKV